MPKPVTNLVTNAFGAIEATGEVRISTANLHIDTPMDAYDSEVTAGDYAVFRARDTGVGIESNDLDRVFEPFYTRKLAGRSGSGLGMSVVWGTVKGHNAYIDVKSVVGEGTTVSIYFPAVRQGP